MHKVVLTFDLASCWSGERVVIKSVKEVTTVQQNIQLFQAILQKMNANGSGMLVLDPLARGDALDPQTFRCVTLLDDS